MFVQVWHFVLNVQMIILFKMDYVSHVKLNVINVQGLHQIVNHAELDFINQMEMAFVYHVHHFVQTVLIN